MSGAIYAAAAGEIFGAIRDIVKLVPTFSEEKKEEYDKQVKHLINLETHLENCIKALDSESRTNEVLYASDLVSRQQKKVEKLLLIYAKEIRGEAE